MYKHFYHSLLGSHFLKTLATASIPCCYVLYHDIKGLESGFNCHFEGTFTKYSNRITT